MSDFKEIFEAYGADYSETIERFMGNEAFYMRMLGMLPDDENLEKLGVALETGNFSAAFEAAHTLKGVAGNLGLTPLYHAVCQMVEPLRMGENRKDYEEMYQNIQNEFHNAEQLLHNLTKGVGMK